MNRYEYIVEAAMAEQASKFDLAQALATAINHQDQAVQLEEAREAIIGAGGEPKSVGTLRFYLKVGAWAMENPSFHTDGWVDGFSFSSHREAMQAGQSLDEFRAAPKTVREIRAAAGKSSPDSPAVAIGTWTEEEKETARKALMDDAVAKIMAEDNPPSVRVRPGEEPKAKAPTVNAEAAAEKRELQHALAEIMHLSRSTVTRAEAAAGQFEGVLPSPFWNSYLPGETVHRTHEEQVLGDIDKAIEALHKLRMRAAKAIDETMAARV